MHPFRVDIPQSRLDDLSRRLAAVRWPPELPAEDWSRGVPVHHLKDLVDYAPPSGG
jgi:microsomal epoxide hydrolase